MEPLQDGDPRSAGEFRLRARLGAGGMGRVYLGYSPGGRAVAVKICRPEFAADPAFVRRFALEVDAARAVNGLYTAQVIDAGPDDIPPWMATSYVPGPSLYDAITADGPLPEPAVWRLAAGLAEALQAVHACGLVHRDLKPTNVLLAADGPRVIDFGVARALDGTSLTTTGVTFGTPSYMSPEQGTGDPLGPASDVFALGSVLCFAATGGVPFGDGDPPSVLYRVIYSPPALDAVPARLRDLVAACLAKNPADRPGLPQILRACQDRAEVAGDPDDGSSGGFASASFWPGEVAVLISRHQAGLRDAAGALRPPGEATRDIDGQIASRLGTWPPAAGSRAAGSRARPPGRPAVSRRRVLAGLGGAGLAVAALAVTGFELTRSDGGRAADAARTGRPARLAWSHQTGGPVTSGAAVAGGVAYIGSDDGHIYAFRAASGHLIWKIPVGGAVSAPVTIAGNRLLAGGADGMVHALSIPDGGRLWRRPTGGPVRCQPTVAGGVVYVGSDDHHVYALRAGSGHPIWHQPTGGKVRSAPRAGRYPYDTLVYVGSDDGNLYGLDTDTGTPAWHVRAGGAVAGGPIQAGAGVYAGSDDGALLSVETDTGNENWRFAAGGAIRGTPVSAGQTVYFGSADRSVYAVAVYTLDKSGSKIWSRHLGGAVNSGLALRGTMLHAGSDDGYLYAIDTTTTTVRWRFRTGGPVRSRILVAGGLVIFGSLDHRVYAVRA
jgi:outer membrane protein assembly factor BamB